MKPDTILQLAIRLLGLVFLYHGIQQVPGGAFQVFSSVLSGNVGAIIMGFVIFGWPLAVAFWLLRGAPLLMRIAFPEPLPGRERQAASQGASDQSVDA